MTLRRLPQVSDALRHEAVEIVRAAERAAREITLCVDAVRDSHKIIKAAERLSERSADVIYTDAAGNQFQKVFRDDLVELKAALGASEQNARETDVPPQSFIDAKKDRDEGWPEMLKGD